MQAKTPNPPGLRLLRGKPIWRATKAAVAAGYPVKSVNLSMYADDSAALERRCERLQDAILAIRTARKHQGL
jgi:hypothetical protein